LFNPYKLRAAPEKTYYRSALASCVTLRPVGLYLSLYTPRLFLWSGYVNGYRWRIAPPVSWTPHFMPRGGILYRCVWLCSIEYSPPRSVTYL